MSGTEVQNSDEKQKSYKRKMTGFVVQNKNDKSITVKVERRFKHPRYFKFLTYTKKYHAHDESNAANVGDLVTIIECRPHSRNKRWELTKQTAS